MGTKRRAYIEEIARRIGRRKLVWFGHNGSNARPLTSLPQFSQAFSVTSPAGLGDHREVCIEQLTGERVRTGGHELHPETSEVDRQFHRQLFDSLGEPTVTVTHQASRFFASVYFLRREFVQHLGLFHERQVVFDHKPWVETELREIGIRVVPWRYLATHDGDLRPALERALQGGPLVLRANRSISGRGLTMVRHPDEIAQVGEGTNPDGFIAVAPFLEPSVPLNVNACVFPDGTVSLHSPSLQLIGIPGAGSPFTYCGNDFAQVRELDEAILDTLQEMATRVGQWLCSMGYAGAFGVDALLYQGTVYLTEVNPRFQGSSLVSASLDAELDRPDMYLTHVAAFLGLSAPDGWDLKTLAAAQRPAAQLYVRNGPKHASRKRSAGELPNGVECWMMPDHAVLVHPQASLCRGIAWRAVTEDGRGLRPDAASWFYELPTVLFDEVNPDLRGDTASPLSNEGFSQSGDGQGRVRVVG